MLNTHRVLIADDDREVRSGVADLIGALGVEVVEAEDGSQALLIARRQSISLAVLDHHMPGSTGLEVLELLHIELPDLPCILCSGDATELIELSARNAGATAVLKKPVQPSLLRELVVRSLGLHGRN